MQHKWIIVPRIMASEMSTESDTAPLRRRPQGTGLTLLIAGPTQGLLAEQKNWKN